MGSARRPLATRVLIPLYERVSRRRPWTEARLLRELQWRSPEELEARGLEKLRALLAHAHAHVPYYRELFQHAGWTPGDMSSAADLSRLPLTGKTELRANFPARVVADNLPARRRFLSATSGSTGMPLRFYADLADRDARLGSYLFFWEWAGAPPGEPVTQLIVSLRPASTVAGSSRLERALRRMALGQRTLHVSGLDVDARQLAALVGRLPSGPDYLLWGLPSPIARVAAELLEGAAAIPRRPRVVIATGETLTEGAAGTMRRAFGCPVVNHYSAYESLHLAQTCPDNPGVLHVNSQRGVVRVVREDGTAAPPGETGRLVVTDLGNWVMPFINYDIGDWAAAGPRCPCGRGFPTITRVEGRVGAAIRTAHGRLVTPVALAWFLTYVCGVAPSVREYQAVVTAPDRLVLRVVPGPHFTAGVARKLEEDLATFLGPGFRVRVETVARIDAEPSGKRLVIKSEPVPGP